jgi:hypothetical protein
MGDMWDWLANAVDDIGNAFGANPNRNGADVITRDSNREAEKAGLPQDLVNRQALLDEAAAMGGRHVDNPYDTGRANRVRKEQNDAIAQLMSNINGPGVADMNSRLQGNQLFTSAARNARSGAGYEAGMGAAGGLAANAGQDRLKEQNQAIGAAGQGAGTLSNQNNQTMLDFLHSKLAADTINARSKQAGATAQSQIELEAQAVKNRYEAAIQELITGKKNRIESGLKMTLGGIAAAAGTVLTFGAGAPIAGAAMTGGQIAGSVLTGAGAGLMRG